MHVDVSDASHKLHRFFGENLRRNVELRSPDVCRETREAWQQQDRCRASSFCTSKSYRVTELVIKKNSDSEAFLKTLQAPGGLALEFVRLVPFLRRRIQLAMDRRLAARLSADDIIQETFLVAQRRLDDFLLTRPMPFNNWIALLAKQETVTAQRWHLASKRRTVLRERHVGHDTLFDFTDPRLLPDRVAESHDQRELLFDLLERLKPGDRRVLVLRELEQYSNADVAALFGISRLAASKRYSRALGRLRAMAKKEDAGPRRTTNSRSQCFAGNDR